MRLNSQIVPISFWIGFLVLGFATSHAGRSAPSHVAAPRRPVAAAAAMHNLDSAPQTQHAARLDNSINSD